MAPCQGVHATNGLARPADQLLRCVLVANIQLTAPFFSSPGMQALQSLSVLPLPVVLHGPLGYCTVVPEEVKLFQAAGLGITTRLTPELLGAAYVELPDGAAATALQRACLRYVLDACTTHAPSMIPMSSPAVAAVIARSMLLLLGKVCALQLASTTCDQAMLCRRPANHCSAEPGGADVHAVSWVPAAHPDGTGRGQR